jgi:hypothetical protein
MIMHRTACSLAAALALLPAVAAAQESLTPRFWAVTGVSAGDVLHLRDVPSAESRSLAGIPPNARQLINLGCRRKEQRALAQTQWCRVEYRGKQGWVAGRYLKSDDTAKR